MTVDLRECVPGTFLLTKHGRVFIYEKYDASEGLYPHVIGGSDGVFRTRTDDGFVYYEIKYRRESDEDIVAILSTPPIDISEDLATL